MLLGAGLVCLLGAIDDIRELDWLTKMGGQMIAAGIMAFSGVLLFQLPHRRGDGAARADHGRADRAHRRRSPPTP